MLPLRNEAENPVTSLLLPGYVYFCWKFLSSVHFFPIDIGILLYKYVKNHSIRTLFLDGVAEIASHINIIPILRQPYWSLIDRGYGWVTLITRKLQP